MRSELHGLRSRAIYAELRRRAGTRFRFALRADAAGGSRLRWGSARSSVLCPSYGILSPKALADLHGTTDERLGTKPPRVTAGSDPPLPLGIFGSTGRCTLVAAVRRTRREGRNSVRAVIGGHPEDQLPFRRTGTRRCDGQSQHDERHVPELSLGTLAFLCANVAGTGNAHLGGSRGVRC